MIKLIVSTCAVISSVLVSLSLTHTLNLRVKVITAFIVGLSSLSHDIEYSRPSLSYSLFKINKELDCVKVKKMIKSCAKRIESNEPVCFGEIWEEELQKVFIDIPTAGQELEVLLHLGKSIGKSDAQTQLDTLSNGITELNKIRLKAQEQATHYISLFSRLTVICSLLLVVIIY